MPIQVSHTRVADALTGICRCWALWALVVVNGSLPAAVAAENRPWELSPYKLDVAIACNDSQRPQVGLEDQLANSIVERAEASLRPLWSLELTVPANGPERRQCFALQEIPWDKLSADQTAADKLLWLGVKVAPNGYQLSCREFDLFTRRWSPIRERFVQQQSYLADACFALLKATFSPLATIQPIEGDDQRVELIFKGGKLPRPSGEDLFAAAGEAYLPLLRRTDRSGKLLEGGVQPVPWTYLTIAEPGDGSSQGKIHSGVRRPFGGAKRGMVEQVAIAVRNPPGATLVRFHARADKTAGLAGYEVFRATTDGDSERIGVTNRDGTIVIPSNGDAVSMMLLRSDGQVLAKAPVASGGADVVQIPIADNVARLQAQAEAQVVREELIDLVARRAIMMGRVKSYLKNGRIDDAKKLMDELNAMPSTSVFGRSIDNAARRVSRTDDPSVQKRIDALFSSTREMLAKFLNSRDVSALQTEVDAASAASAAEPAATTAEPTG